MRQRTRKPPQMPEVITPKQKWATTHNQRRRDDYATDPEYRETVIKRNQQSYREKTGAKPRNCLVNLRRMALFGGYCDVVIDGELYTRQLVFTVKQLAEMAGSYHPIVFYRWATDNKFPRPEIHCADKHGNPLPNRLVYSEDQAKRLLTVLGKHQAEKQYFHNTDTETIEKLFAAMAG